ncbi:TetR/AcrR family transcriptional regulator [Saccharothrix syringae]|uniref:TetR/AcrR family transcriptional regulator n=1 Tax=Saccharothrix syringae TaxID=103733 RepID=A0A5Q0HA02_SACSY|nr:TetR family transcriptional regulator [Saccharothrix syringae]QFZ23051.1 TetR/AcrR family transcriptional regulator [Saccharothrix syringae]
MEFQRARRPEQVAQRRRAILDTARRLLRERPVAEISLRELSDCVGLAKSNVLRYFDSREAVFLEVLDGEWGAWLDELEGRLDGVGDPVAVASVVAASLVARPLLCELVSGMAGVLERNVSVESARGFKARAGVHSGRLAGLVRERVPGVGEAGARHFAHAVLVITAGLWPHANPTEAVARVMRELGSPGAAEVFATGLREFLVNQLAGLVARSTG